MLERRLERVTSKVTTSSITNLARTDQIPEGTVVLWNTVVYLPHVKPILSDETLVKDGPQKIKGKSFYEDAMIDVLLGNKITAHYEAASFLIKGNDIYAPDFITDLTVNGKQVIFEVHSLSIPFFVKNNSPYYKKRHEEMGKYKARMRKFMLGHGDSYYFVVIDSFLSSGRRPFVGFPNYADEHWGVPLIRDESNFRSADIRYWKKQFRRLLSEFIEQRTDAKPLIDAHRYAA